MPGTFYQPISRKQFLKRTLWAGVGATLGVPHVVRAGLQAEAHWAFLSDTHVAEDMAETYRDFNPYQNLQTTVSEVLRRSPQGAIINGDVARLSGEPGDYQNVHKLLTPLANELPVHMTLGNHDDRDNFTQQFDTLETKVPDKHVLVVEAQPVRFILLDSLLCVNKVPGMLGETQRSWLEMFLDTADDKPTLLFVHHTLGDEDADLQDVERMFGIIAPHPSVKAVLYGHSHQYQYDTYKGIHLINLPAVGYNFSDEEPIGWLEAKLTDKGGGFTLHTLGGKQANDGKTTELTWR